MSERKTRTGKRTRQGRPNQEIKAVELDHAPQLVRTFESETPNARCLRIHEANR